MRTLESIKRLPEEIRNSNAIFLTVPQAKGLEFDDGERMHNLVQLSDQPRSPNCPYCVCVPL